MKGTVPNNAGHFFPPRRCPRFPTGCWSRGFLGRPSDPLTRNAPKLELEQQQKLRLDEPALLVDKHRLACLNPHGLSQPKNQAMGTPRTNNKRQAQIKENKHSPQALKLQAIMLRKVQHLQKRMQECMQHQPKHTRFETAGNKL